MCKECETFHPRMCRGCQALSSARDYIRILEIRVTKQIACIRDLTNNLNKQDAYIRSLEEQLHPLTEIEWKEDK